MLTLFPFLRKSAHQLGLAGIAVDGDGVAIARVKREAGESLAHVESCEYLPFDEGRTPASIIAKWVSHNGLKGASSVAVMEPGSYQLLQVEPPDVEPEEMREAVRWRIKDLVDFSVEDAAIDLFELPEGGARGRTAYVVAAASTAIKPCIEMLQESQLEIRAIDITELALRNIARCMPENETGVALLWVGRENSQIGIYRQSNLYLARNISTGWSQLTAAEGASDGALALVPDESLLDGMVLEMQRSLDYYESHFGQNPINTLVVLPTVEPVPALLGHLEQNMAIGVRMFDPESMLEWSETPDPETLARCMIALGGALREEREAP